MSAKDPATLRIYTLLCLLPDIADRLERADLLALRSTCRDVCVQVDQLPQFRDHVKCNTVCMNTDALENLEYHTSHGTIGRLLGDITIIGVLDENFGEEELRRETAMKIPRSLMTNQSVEKNPRHIQLLGQIFANIKERSPTKSLAALRLRVMDNRPGKKSPVELHYRAPQRWHGVWNMAQYLFESTVSALLTAQLPLVGTLDVFWGQDECSLTCDRWIGLTARKLESGPSWHTVFSGLKDLRLSLSAPHLIQDATTDYFSQLYIVEQDPFFPTQQHPNAPLWYPDDVMVHVNIEAQQCEYILKTLNNTVALLSSLPNLELLSMHWFNLGLGTSVPCASEETAAAWLTDMPHWEDGLTDWDRLSRKSAIGEGIKARPVGLKSLALAGFHVHIALLLRTLQTLRPEHVDFDSVKLVDGEWGVVFDYMTAAANRSTNPIRSFILNNLFTEYHIYNIFFPGPGEPKFHIPGEIMPSTLARSGDEATLPIIYQLLSEAPGFLSVYSSGEFSYTDWKKRFGTL